MAAKYLLDSTLIIDHLRDVHKATAWIRSLGADDAVVSVITRAEVLTKAGDAWEAVTFMLDEFPCLGIEPDDADIAAGLRAKYHIKLPDALQAALAKNHDLTLITRDEADFKKVSDLDYKIPYKI